MSDEIKNPDLNEDTAAGSAQPDGEDLLEEAQQDGANLLNEELQNADAALNNELNDLKDLFQKELDKAIAEQDAPTEPVIQALDDTPDPEDAEENEEDDEAALNGASASDKKKKEKRAKKKRSKAPLIIVIVLLVLIIVPLAGYVFMSVKAPTFPNFISAYAKALSAKEPAEQIAAYENALSYCEDGSGLEFNRQSLHETLVLLKCEAEGYASAYSYMTANMSEEEQKASRSKDFKAFLAVSDSVNAIADGAYEATDRAVTAAGSADKVDYDALAKELGAPDLIVSDVAEILRNFAKGIETEHNGNFKEDFNTIMSAYFGAVSDFRGLGADTQKLMETAIVKMYNGGFISEAVNFINNYFGEEMLSNVRTEEFKAMQAQIEALKAVDIDLYSVAAALFQNNTVAPEDIKAAMDLSIPDKDAAVLTDIAISIVDALQAEKDKNLTKASAGLNEALNAVTALDLPTAGLVEKLLGLLLQTGNDQNAVSLRTSKIDDAALENGSAELKALVEKIDAIKNGQSAAENALNGLYSGNESPTKADVIAAMDALESGSKDKYEIAYAEYYKYLAESRLGDTDNAAALKYLQAFSKAFTEYPAFYNTLLAEAYRMEGNYDKVLEVANQTLAYNIGDDYANGMVALILRIRNDLDGALAAAEKGMELSDTVFASAEQAVICHMLKGDLEKAFQLAKQLYDTNTQTQMLTLNHCDYILLIAASYDGSDAALKEEIDSYKAQVEELYANNGITVDENVQSVIDGSTTLEDIFTEEPYAIR